MNPPWKEYPDYTPHCMGFRMGSGEDYMDAWGNFWNSLDDKERADFKEQNPAPKGWKYCYA